MLSMEAYETEEQQLEAIKRWFKKYGNILSWGITLIALTLGAIIYWRHHQAVLDQEASERYFSLLSGVEQGDEKTLESTAQALLTEFPSSIYATFASLMLANESVKVNAYDKAQAHLEWVIQHGKSDNFQALARVRLVRLLIAENKLEEAMKWVDEKKAAAFLTLMEELKGDILFKQNKKQEAREAYEKAYLNAPESGMTGPLLKMKLDELGGLSQEAKKKTEKEAKQ